MPRPVLTIAEMRAWEAATWAAGVRENDVIERAGAAVAARLRPRLRPDSHVLVLAGRGNNGADARHAAAHLPADLTRVEVVHSPAAVADVAAWLDAHRDAEVWILDGLFGIGLNRPLDADWQHLIRVVNQSGRPVLAVEVPSGLNADTGEVMGAAIRARATVTLGAVKRGLLATAAAPYVGRLELATDIGLVANVLPAAPLTWALAADFRGFPPPRAEDGHKGMFGHVAILAGSLGYHGAAVLAARGALAERPGLVTVLTDERCYVPVASALAAAMVRPWRPGFVTPERFSTLLIGPGLAADDLSPDLRREVVRLWQGFPGPVVVDASALAWLPPGTVPRDALRVLTPHPGEAGRLLRRTNADVQADRPAALRELSRAFGGCWVVLKGRHTLVGRAAGDVSVNATGNPCLAQGGTGDVLAGFIAGLLAQPVLAADPALALRLAVWEHGATADRLEAAGSAWTAVELAAALRRG
ncbi:MAG: NAD(P)H-hydrate dehydratase [Limisphaerales bacterium]